MQNRFSKYTAPQPIAAPNPLLPGQVQGQSIHNQKDSALTPYEIRSAKAKAAKDELDLRTAREQYASQHPNTQTNGLYGEAYLKTLPASEQHIIKALTEGRLAFPNGAGMRSPAWMQKLQEVAQYDPTFDATNFNARAKGRASAIAGKLGGSNNALNTAIGHLGQLYGQIDGTASHQGFPLATTVNHLQNAYTKHQGDPGVTNFEQTAGLIADELEAAYRNGGGSEAGVIRNLRSLNADMSRDQKLGVIHNAMDLLSSKISANLSQYNFGTGGKPTWDMLDGHTQHVLDTVAPDLKDKYFAGAAPASSSTPPKELGPDQQAQFFSILQSQGADKADEYLHQFGMSMKDKSAADRPYSKQLAPEKSYANSYLGQGMSGANEGLAGVLGAPVDLMTGAMNLIPKGINAAANTDIPTIQKPFAGGEWFKDRLTDLGSILPASADPSKQFTRRVGESVGAAAVPGMFAGSLPKFAANLIAGAGGGFGGATAQQVAPGNPLAEMGGELAGSLVPGVGIANAGRRAAQREIEAAIPTVGTLKQQASDLYQKAETNGVIASPKQTRDLMNGVRTILRDEGQIGPSGKITSADTNTSKAFNLIQQYSGKSMRPQEMDTVRKVLADGRQSADPADRRLGGLLLDHFDNWTEPLAPEFKDARSVSSRYLQAQDLETARDLAAARASQFTGSGFENALRTEYRSLDRANIKGQNHFAPDVTDAIQKVARGTPTSNILRGVGRFAPTGPVSGMGSLVPAMGIGAMTSPATGGAVGTGLAGLGIAGRVGATRMGIRAADVAELTARNGGKVDQAPMLTPDVFDEIARWAAAQQAKYLNH